MLIIDLLIRPNPLATMDGVDAIILNSLIMIGDSLFDNMRLIDATYTNIDRTHQSTFGVENLKP